MDMQGASQKRTTLAPSWESIPFLPLFRKTIVPALIGGVVIGAWYAWHFANPDVLASWLFNVILAAVAVLLISGQTAWYLKTIDISASQMVVVSGWTGIVMGILVAIISLYMNFSYLGLFRLIADPLMAALACVVVSWLVHKVGGKLLFTQ
jgi:phosphatidylserine synthase